jgi:hypothetical protein
MSASNNVTLVGEMNFYMKKYLDYINTFRYVDFEEWFYNVYQRELN